MNLFGRLLQRLKPQAVIVLPDPARVVAPHTRLQWRGEDSQTRQDILWHLQFGPMTRRQIDAVLDVQTAGLLLPRLVEAGAVVRTKTRPYKYSLSVRQGTKEVTT